MATITISVPVDSEWPPSTGQPWPQCPVAACKWFSTGCSPASLPVRRATSKLPACNRDVEARTRAKTSESGPRESKWPGRPMPATSWPARVGRRGPHLTSDTSRQVMCFPSFASILLIPFKSRSGINAGGAVVEQPCRMREVLGSNPAVFFILPILIYWVIPHITRYIPFLSMYIPVYPNISRYIVVYTFSIYVYTSISQYFPGLAEYILYIPVYSSIPCCTSWRFLSWAKLGYASVCTIETVLNVCVSFPGKSSYMMVKRVMLVYRRVYTLA